jgi:hypothetical protein
MNPEETWFFEQIDNYSRLHYHFFVSEMTPDGAKDEYALCFRPVDATKDSPDRYVCRYLRVRKEMISVAYQNGRLLPTITQLLASELT